MYEVISIKIEVKSNKKDVQNEKDKKHNTPLI